MRSSLSIIIVTYNNQFQLADCLKSVFKNIERFGANIIIVDNDSQDKTLDILKKLVISHDNIFIIKNKAIILIFLCKKDLVYF